MHVQEGETRSIMAENKEWEARTVEERI